MTRSYNMNDKEELRSSLEQVPRSYKDFVDGVSYSAEKHGLTQKLMQMLDEGKNITTDDVLEYLYELKQKKLQNEAE